MANLKSDQTEDFNIVMENVQYFPPQQYYGTIVLFMIKGTAQVRYEGQEDELKENDILFINRNSRYSIRGNEENILISLSISSHFFALH